MKITCDLSYHFSRIVILNKQLKDSCNSRKTIILAYEWALGTCHISQSRVTQQAIIDRIPQLSPRYKGNTRLAHWCRLIIGSKFNIYSIISSKSLITRSTVHGCVSESIFCQAENNKNIRPFFEEEHVLPSGGCCSSSTCIPSVPYNSDNPWCFCTHDSFPCNLSLTPLSIVCYRH